MNIQYSLWIVPEGKLSDKVKELMNPLINKLIHDEESEEINNQLEDISQCVIASRIVDDDIQIELGDIFYLFTDKEVYFKNVYGRLKMYLGKEAFLKSMNKHSFKR